MPVTCVIVFRTYNWRMDAPEDVDALREKAARLEGAATFLHALEATLPPGRPVSFLWPNTKTGHLLVTTRWSFVERRWECVGLTIQFAPDYPIRPLNAKDVARLGMTKLLDYAGGLWRRELEKSRYLDAIDPETREAPPNPRSAEEALPRRRGRPRLSLETMQEVAKVYEEAFENHLDPTDAVLKHFPALKTRNTAASWIFKARNEYHLLPPTRRGVAKGHRLPKLEEDT